MNREDGEFLAWKVVGNDGDAVGAANQGLIR